MAAQWCCDCDYDSTLDEANVDVGSTADDLGWVDHSAQDGDWGDI